MSDAKWTTLASRRLGVGAILFFAILLLAACGFRLGSTSLVEI